jgi:ABC-type dipeptide/oligopeptide/nickel transport system permease subunit
MTITAAEPLTIPDARAPEVADAPDRLWRRVLASRRIVISGGVLLLTLLLCVATLPWTYFDEATPTRIYYDRQDPAVSRQKPAVSQGGWLLFGTDLQGRSLLGRCLLGGTISLAVGAAAAASSVVLGVTVGLVAGYRGGWVDSLLMRLVDILYGLPYILIVILFQVAFQNSAVFTYIFRSNRTASVAVLFIAIGLVSWLTMARVVRGQVLSLRAQPFIEACRASGLTEWRIFTRHLLPNLVGPVLVYATLTVPQAILQESFLSFLGVGVNAPLPTWGSLASEGVAQMSPVKIHWWLIFFPCALLAITLLSLNFLGDGLRDVFDPKKEAAKI